MCTYLLFTCHVSLNLQVSPGLPPLSSSPPLSTSSPMWFFGNKNPALPHSLVYEGQLQFANPFFNCHTARTNTFLWKHVTFLGLLKVQMISVYFISILLNRLIPVTACLKQQTVKQQTVISRGGRKSLSFSELVVLSCG